MLWVPRAQTRLPDGDMARVGGAWLVRRVAGLLLGAVIQPRLVHSHDGLGTTFLEPVVLTLLLMLVIWLLMHYSQASMSSSGGP